MNCPKQIRRFLPLSFILFLPLASVSQKQEVDAVYLLNGEIYRGRIQEQSPPGIVKLETLCGNTRVFAIDEISRTERETVDLPAFRWEFTAPPRGYFNRTDLGILIGSGNNSRNAIFSVQMVNGYKLGRVFYPGLGTGIEFYEYPHLPLFADVSWKVLDERVSPFLHASLGYSLPLEDPGEQWGSRTDNLGGVLCAASLGTTVRTGPSSALVISLAYRYQSLRSTQTEEWTGDVRKLERKYNRLSLRIGFLFD